MRALRLIQGGLSLKTRVCAHCLEKLTAKDFDTLDLIESNCMHKNARFMKDLELAEFLDSVWLEGEIKERKLK